MGDSSEKRAKKHSLWRQPFPGANAIRLSFFQSSAGALTPGPTGQACTAQRSAAQRSIGFGLRPMLSGLHAAKRSAGAADVGTHSAFDDPALLSVE